METPAALAVLISSLIFSFNFLISVLLAPFLFASTSCFAMELLSGLADAVGSTVAVIAKAATVNSLQNVVFMMMCTN